jgi:hypothetical protein
MNASTFVAQGFPYLTCEAASEVNIADDRIAQT